MPDPDFLEPTDEATRRDAMLARLPASWDRTEGSPWWDLLAAIAIQQTKLHEHLRLSVDVTFAETSYGQWLERRAAERGVARDAATPAVGSLRFTGVDGTTIVAGTEFSTEQVEGGPPAQVFATDEDVTIAGGVADVAATATTPGAAGNVGATTVTFRVNPTAPAGLASVTNLAPFTGGTDIETDEELLEKLLSKVRNPGTSGNVANYRNWALEVPGVGAVDVVALEDGPGTVTIAILDGDKEVPGTTGLRDLVQELIAPQGANEGTGLAPVGAAVTVENGIDVPIDIQATLAIATGFDAVDVQAAAEVALDEYLRSIAFEADNDVRHARVVTALLDTPGVVDATAVGIRRGAAAFAAANIAVARKERATRGAVAWT